jgi:hypothetical protein
MTDSQPQRPEASVGFGAIQAAVWKNTSQEGHTRFNVTLERRYVDGQGDWHSSSSFGRDDLLTLGEVAREAYRTVHDLQKQERDKERARANGTVTEQAKSR